MTYLWKKSALRLFKHFARTYVYPFITSTGTEKIFSTFSKNNKLILVYHGVVQQPNHRVSVGPIALQQFAQHLNYLKQNFHIVPLHTIFEMHQSGHRPKQKTIALTFDDGYQNNYTHVFPLLKESKTPATIFVVTENMEDENRITWYDYLDLVKSELRVAQLDYAAIERKPCRNIDELKRLVTSLPFATRERLFLQIRGQLGNKDFLSHYPAEQWKLLNENELRELAASGIVEIGAHTHHHPNLGLVPLPDAQQEIAANKTTLERIIGKEITSIAFPDGSYNESVKALCRRAGFKNLLAVNYRYASDLSERDILERYCVSSTTTLEANLIQINRGFNRYGF